MTDLWEDFYLTKSDLDATKKIIADQHFGPEFYRKKTDGLIKQNGKMIRAALTILFGRYAVENKTFVNSVDIESSTKKIRQAAAAIELLHLATLVHDDVIDASPERRGLPTLQTSFQNKDAIYLGDILFTKYFQMLVKIAPDISFIDFHSRFMEKILDGELKQDSLRFDSDLTFENYIDVISKKTAALFALASISGFWIGTAIKEYKQISKNKLFSTINDFGKNIGIAFQIIDDLQDLDPKVYTGKPKFEDFKEGVYTLPIIIASSDKDFKKQIMDNDKFDRKKLEEYFRSKPEILKKTLDIGYDFIQRAQIDLDKLPVLNNQIKSEVQKIIDIIKDQLNLINTTSI